LLIKNDQKKKQGLEKVSLNDFHIEKVIGMGGFAEKVYLARKKDTGSIYAIKSIAKEFLLSDKGRLRQVFSELKVMQRLQGHPFVVTLRYAFQSSEYVHLALDFCSGGELFYFLS